MEAKSLWRFRLSGFLSGFILTVITAALPHWLFFVRNKPVILDPIVEATIFLVPGAIGGAIFAVLISLVPTIVWAHPEGLEVLCDHINWSGRKRARNFYPLGIMAGFVIAKILGMSWGCFIGAAIFSTLLSAILIDHDWSAAF